MDYLDDRVRPAHAPVFVRDRNVAIVAANRDALPTLRERHLLESGTVGGQTPTHFEPRAVARSVPSHLKPLGKDTTG